ncbi:MAG: hypothetical protein KDD37_00760 [Bdellovibrionales bacterium]|nr:hypothetical protein [Bdellovibrionales bacterium]
MLKVFILYLTILIVVTSCGENTPDVKVYGKITENEIRAENGEPSSIVTEGDKSYLTYSDGSSYVSVAKIIESKSRNATEEEREIQYWRQKWRDSKIREEEHKGGKAHTEQEFMLINLERGISVLFSKPSGQVQRVYEY